MLALFVAQELRTDHPLIELRMFSDRDLLAVDRRVHVRHRRELRPPRIHPAAARESPRLSAMRVGMMFFIPALIGMVGMSFGGRLVDRVGPRRPIIVGCAAMFVAMIGFSQLTLDHAHLR